MNKQLRRKEISTCVASEGVAAVERATSKQPELHPWNDYHIAARQRFVGIVRDQPAPFSRAPRSAGAGPRHSRVATGLPNPQPFFAPLRLEPGVLLRGANRASRHGACCSKRLQERAVQHDVGDEPIQVDARCLG